jgi:phosphate-selective porin OprO/OprP
MKNSSTRTMTAKRIAVAVAAVCATLSAPSFAAGSDMKALMDLLLKKGVITQQEYDQNIQAAAENEAFKEKRLADDVNKLNKLADKTSKGGYVKPSGFGFESADGANSINLTGRLHFDARSIDNNFGEFADRDSGAIGDRFTVRRARLGINGVFNKDFSYEMVTNLTGSNANATNSNTSTSFVDTAWVNYAAKPETQFRFGKFKQPYGLETLTSSNNISFMERSYQDQIAPGKQLGAMFHGEVASNYVYAVSGYQKDFDPASSTNGLAPEGAIRFAGNFANAFNAGSDAIIHFGVAGTAGKQQIVPTTSSQSGSNIETKGSIFAFNDENAGLRNVFRNRIFGTPPCSAPASTAAGCSSHGFSLPASEAATVNKKLIGLEFIGAYGPTKFQSEYTRANYDATSRAFTGLTGNFYSTRTEGDVKVFYVEMMHNITGESWAPTYKNGVIGNVKPNSPFRFTDMSGKGAWQLGLRFSRYDASDFGSIVNGGETCSPVASCTNSRANGVAQYSLEGSTIGTTYTLGLNWILNSNARIMFNYSQTKFDKPFLPVDIGVPTNTVLGDKENIVSVRSQFNF